MLAFAQAGAQSAGHGRETVSPLEVAMGDASFGRGFTAEALELSAPGVSLPAVLYRPATPGPHAGVLVAPGGLALGETEAYVWAGELLAAAGYAALVVTYRAASPYDDPVDLQLGLDALEKDASIDSRRLAAFGHSRGGLSVLGAAAVDGRLKAVVSVAAPADLTAYVGAIGVFFPMARSSIVQFMTGEPAGIPEKYESVNALSLAGRIRQPVLLVHGQADMRVPLHHSMQLEAALRSAGNQDTRLEVVPGMGHYFELGTLGYEFDLVMTLVTAWLGDRL
jgi:dipeptidyl aminopeptidase/acylaminoacyl peptidase